MDHIVNCKTCNGRGKVQAGYAGEELQDCPDCTRCGFCCGTGVIDSGGFTPWGAAIDIPCPDCDDKKRLELISIGAAWKKDSSLEKWFPFTAEELQKLKDLNEDKAKTIAAYCRMASLDKWRVRRLLTAIDQYLSEDGYRDASDILTRARADAVNAKPSEKTPFEPTLETPTGPLKNHAMLVPAGDCDREYCTGFNHGLILAEEILSPSV